MNYFNRLSILVLLVASPLLASASSDISCVNDKDGRKGAQNGLINDLIKKANDPLAVAFFTPETPDKTSTAGDHCVSCTAAKPFSGVQKLIDGISSLTKEAAPKVIKKECIEASLQREVVNTGYICYDQKATPFQSSGSNTPCLNQQSVDYLHFALNKAVSCLSRTNDPIDPRFILKKINNETAFNFFLAYSQGVGIGQLTSYPVRELAGWYQKGKFNPGNARYILEDLAKNEDPECNPFKQIAEKDLVNNPLKPQGKRTATMNRGAYCNFVSPGAGLTRSLVYSLGYYVYLRDQIVKPAVAQRSPGLVREKELINNLTLIAYGPGGTVEMKALIAQHRLGKNSAAAVNAKLKTSSTYLKATEAKMRELLKIADPTAPINDAALRGDKCLAQL